MTGLTYNPITKRYKLDDKDNSVNYMIRAIKPAT
jgi:2-polyprenyl-6-hydroxyphenyl methylase/3-demethylubiquinone-9 3-methyltransferase